MARQKIRPQILTAAIALFGTSGYQRVRTKDLAREAGVLEASIYRYFRSKEQLYLVAVHSVVEGSINELARLSVSRVQDNSATTDSFESLVITAIRRWYLSFSKEGARLLQQASMTDSSLKALADSPLEQVATILTRAIQNCGKTDTACDDKTFATTLITALLQVKVGQQASTTDELQETDRFIQEWIARLPRNAGNPT